MKTIIDSRGIVNSNFEESTTLTVQGTSTFNGNVTVSGTLTSVSTNTNIYVNSITGSDSNPGTAQSPVSSFLKALQLLPVGRGSQRRIYFASGTYEIPDYTTMCFPQPIGVEEPVILIGGFSTMISGTVTSAESVVGTVTGSATNLTVDAYAGKQIRFTSGVEAGNVYLISNNTTSSFKLSGWPYWNGDPSPGDTYVVEQPNVTINFGLLPAIEHSILAIHGIKLQAMSGTALAIQDSSAVYLQGVEIAANDINAGLVVLNNSTVTADLLQTYFPNMLFNSGGYPGYSQTNGRLTLTTFGAIYGQATYRSTNINAIQNTALSFTGMDSASGSWLIDHNSTMELSQYNRIMASPSDGLRITKRSSLNIYNSSGLVVANSVGSGIIVASGSYARLTGVSGSNAARGLVVAKNSSVDVTDPNTGTVISGTTGAVLVGGNASPTTWALINAGGIAAVTDFSASVPQFCRVQAG